jgi:ferredoxin/flavodoxin
MANVGHRVKEPVIMNTEIYYFSGTGNSLAVARGIADALGATLRSIPQAMEDGRCAIDAGAVGLVFPVYHKSIPLIVKRFVERLERIEGTYLFAVYTYGDTSGLAARHVSQLVRARGGELAAGFGVQMPYNYLTPALKLRGFFDSFTLREVPLERQRALLAQAPQRIEEIVAAVRAGEMGALDEEADALTRLADRLGLPETLAKPVWLRVAGVKDAPDVPFIESRQWMDDAFHADESCISCGTCARVCPVGNVTLVGGVPAWHHRCEQCFACLQWCPEDALQFGSETAGKRRYHHPDVTVADMARAAGTRTEGEEGGDR